MNLKEIDPMPIIIAVVIIAGLIFGWLNPM